MKKLVLLLATGLTMITAHAQRIREDEMPPAVKNAFEKRYPDTKAEWEKKGLNYEADLITTV